MKLNLQNNNIEMYSTRNEAKYIVAGRFIRTFKKKFYVYDFNIKKCVIDKLHDIVNKHNNTNHSTIKLKLTDVKSNTYINSTK